MSEELFAPRRLVLRRRAGGEVARVAGCRGWRRLGWERCPDGVEETTWRVAGGVFVYYLRDLVFGDCAVEVGAADPVVAERLVADLAVVFDALSVRELLDAVDGQDEPRGLGRALYRLILGAPPRADPRVLARVRVCLTHPDSDLRLIAMYALLNRPWPQYRNLLGERAEHDPDGDVRLMATRVLAAYDVAAVPDGGDSPCPPPRGQARAAVETGA